MCVCVCVCASVRPSVRLPSQYGKKSQWGSTITLLSWYEERWGVGPPGAEPAGLTTGSVGWKTLKSRLQMAVGRMWSWWTLAPGRMPLRARNTARGEPMQKKFSTWKKKPVFILRSARGGRCHLWWSMCYCKSPLLIVSNPINRIYFPALHITTPILFKRTFVFVF